MAGEETVAALRSALQVSPDNLPLVLHLGDTLLSLGRGDEAEREFRAALNRWSDDAHLKVGLARAFEQQGKTSHAQVVLEEICGKPDAPARGLVLYARLLLRAGEVDKAVRTYKRGLAADPTAADETLAEQLGVRPAAPSADHDHDEEIIDGRERQRLGGEIGPAGEIERPKIAFSDVGGMETVKEEIRLKIIYPIQHADLYRSYGKAIGGGILLYGPPGCGKTHLARATAGEIKAGFMNIGINDVLDMWIGQSEKNLHALFDQARRSQPCVMFFDEVDALAASRTDLRQSAGRQAINQFLAELDGVQASNDGLLILAATNAPWHLDSAFRRPGRFDRILFVPPPDAQARAEILRVLLKGKPVDNIDHEQVAKKTDGFSGADLKAVIDVAVEGKLKQAMKEGIPRPLTTKDLLNAAAGIKPSTREWFASARNYALYANQGGAYDDVLKYLDKR
ncbi:MAG: AAA family ATPase [Planctomycetes bacterium]|nr:AAA family ATPase [Planctomycetota bacterium]